MKWFIKCLKHYADFCGRARRKEYWLFVLFNVLFALAWMILSAIVIWFYGVPDGRASIAFYTASFSYFAAMFLPGLAVSVRRLHDTGKSGWMVLVWLIPVVGAIWLLVLMLKDSQHEENKYGPNPKTSPETFSEQARLKSAGVVLIVVSIERIFGTPFCLLVLNIPLKIYFASLFHSNVMLEKAVYVALLAAGILLLKATLTVEGNTKTAIIAVLAGVAVLFLLSVLGVFSLMNAKLSPPWPIMADYFIHAVCYLPVILFAVSLLLSPQNRDFTRKAAVLTIVFSGLHLLWAVWALVAGDALLGPVIPVLSFMSTSSVFLPIAFIVLAGTFYPEKLEQ